MKPIFLVLILKISLCFANIDPTELKCLVCESTIDEIKSELDKIDPSSKIEVGGFQLDNDGNYKSKSISKAKSEVHISEILENICEKMDNYVRANWKSNGKLTLLNLMAPGGAMNSKLSEVDIVQDGDLNQSLKNYCLNIIEENEDDIISLIKDDKINSICSSELQICREGARDEL